MTLAKIASTFFVLVSAALLSPGIVPAAQPPQAKAPAPSGTPSSSTAVSPATTPSISEVWKSQTTQNEYRVRIQGDTLTADWVNLPPDTARQGGYIRTVCRRVGTRWVGTTRSRLSLPCTEAAGRNGHPTKWCSLITRTEIDSISPDLITGQAEAPHQLSCESCRLVQAQWKKFTWVPKR